MNKTIFISIAAQDDQELKYTVQNIFNNAEAPERVTVGIALTAMKKTILKEAKSLVKKYNVKLDFVKQKKNDLSVLGIGKGRSRAAALYEDQDYMIQVDCHSLFDKAWDIRLIELFEDASKTTKEEKFVLTAIPPAYKYCCKKHHNAERTGAETRYPYYETQKFFVNVIPKWTESNIIMQKHEKFLPSAKVSPAFIMGDRNFAKNTGIHKEATFYDEDLTQTFNLFSNGFVFVFPNIEDLPVMHLDSKGIVKGHDRFFLLDYLDQEHSDKLHENMQKQYLDFAKKAKKTEFFEAYKQYAKVDLIKGCFTNNQELVPESFKR